jgi:hypothetical protein
MRMGFSVHTLYARHQNLQIASPDELEWIDRFGIRGVKTLPVRLNSSRARRAA